jgi:tetratricopeptide (TPR) repeat protein
MHHGLGMAYQRMQQPAKARQQLDKALALYSIESDLSAVFRLENDLGDLLLHQGHLEAAEQHFRSALTGSEALHMDRRGRGQILANLAEVSLRRGDLDQARQKLDEAMEIGGLVGEQVVLANTHALFGQLESLVGDLQKARGHFDAAIRILETLDMPDRLRECHIACAESLYEHGDIGSAALHWKAAAEIGRLVALGVRSGRETTVNGEEEPAALAR